MHQLLISRYKVENLYPGCPYQVDDILTDDGKYAVIDQHGNPVPAEKFDHYPYLFRKLHWSEEREMQEMPEFVKIIERPSLTGKPLEIGDIVPVLKHYSDSKGDYNPRGCQVFGDDFMTYIRCTPATKGDYQLYIEDRLKQQQ